MKRLDKLSPSYISREATCLIVDSKCPYGYNASCTGTNTLSILVKYFNSLW